MNKLKAYLISSFDSPMVITTYAPHHIVYDALCQDAEDDEQYIELIVEQIISKGFTCNYYWAKEV